MKVKILVTGGEGFLGRNLVPSLLKEGNSVFVVSHSKKNSKLQPHHSLTIVQGDYSDENIQKKFLPGTDWVIHLAYSTVPENSTANPVFDIESNVISSLRFFKMAACSGVKNFLFVSSGGVVYGNKSEFPIQENEHLEPLSSYGISKMMIETQMALLAKSFEMNYCIFRIANAYGTGHFNNKNQGVINIWRELISKQIPLKVIGDGTMVRDYIYIDDIIEAFILAVKKNISGVYNIGTGVGTDLNGIIHLLEKSLLKKALIESVPDRKFDVGTNILSYEKFKKTTGWFPKITLEAGIEKLIQKSL